SPWEAWNAPGVRWGARQQLLRALIVDIIVDVDEKARDAVLTIRWRGGQHSELRVRKPRTGEHGCATTEDALAVMRSMAHASQQDGLRAQRDWYQARRDHRAGIA